MIGAIRIAQRRRRFVQPPATARLCDQHAATRLQRRRQAAGWDDWIRLWQHSPTRRRAGWPQRRRAAHPPGQQLQCAAGAAAKGRHHRRARRLGGSTDRVRATATAAARARQERQLRRIRMPRAGRMRVQMARVQRVHARSRVLESRRARAPPRARSSSAPGRNCSRWAPQRRIRV